MFRSPISYPMRLTLSENETPWPIVVNGHILLKHTWIPTILGSSSVEKLVIQELFGQNAQLVAGVAAKPFVECDCV